MTPEQFTYWLQGFLEIRGTDEPLTTEQVKVIREHMAKVLMHVGAPAPVIWPQVIPTAPVYPDPFPGGPIWICKGETTSSFDIKAATETIVDSSVQ